MFTVLGHVFQDKFQSGLFIDFFSIWGGLGAQFSDLWVDFLTSVFQTSEIAKDRLEPGTASVPVAQS